MQAPWVTAGEVPDHHAEAVVERHRHADAVVLRVAERLADEVAVVEDVVVRERGALGEAGRARRVLDVDRVVELERRLALRELAPSTTAAPSARSVVPVVLEHERLRERRAARRAPRRASRRSRSARKPRAATSRLTPTLLQRVLELGRLVGRVDVDEDRRRCARSAYWMTTHSKRFGDQMPTRSPFSTPRASRPRAARSTSSQSSP